MKSYFDLYKIIALFNVIVIVVLFADCYFPIENEVSENFDSFETSSVTVRSRTSTTYQVNNYVICQNGHDYFLTELPQFEGEFKKGYAFTLTETYFLGKIKRITLQKEWESFSQDIGFLHYQLNRGLYIIALGFSFGYLFYPHKVLHFCLAVSTVFTVFMSLAYLF